MIPVLEMTLKKDIYGQNYLVEKEGGCVCAECGKRFNGEDAIVVDSAFGDVMCPECRANLLMRLGRVINQLSDNERQVLYLIASDDPATIFG